MMTDVILHMCSGFYFIYLFIYLCYLFGDEHFEGCYMFLLLILLEEWRRTKSFGNIIQLFQL